MKRNSTRVVGAARRGLFGTLAVVLIAGLSLAVPMPASAAPRSASPVGVTEPGTVEQAKRAWLDAAHEYETFGQRVLLAEQNVAKAKTVVTAARTKVEASSRTVVAADALVAAAQRKVAAADVTVGKAEATVLSYQNQLDAFTNATFRGARTGTLSAMLLADSPDEFLDSATTLDVIAADNHDLLISSERAVAAAETARGEAAKARAGADQIKTKANAARAAAVTAKKNADAAVVDAEQARRKLDSDKVELDKKISAYQLLFAQLSDADRQDAEISAGDNSAALFQTTAADRSRDNGAAPPSANIPSGDALSIKSAKAAPNTAAGIAVVSAISRVGLPYVWAATGPDAFDCSGLTQWAWAQAGVHIPRTSAEQSTLPEVPLEKLEPGDLVTFYSPVTHVVIYIGFGLVVNASTSGMPIKVMPLMRSGPVPTGHKVNR